MRFHKDDFDDNANDGDFIDDDALMQRFPPGNDVIMTSSLPARTDAAQELPVRSK